MKSLSSEQVFSQKRLTIIVIGFLIAFSTTMAADNSADAAIKGVTKASKQSKASTPKTKMNFNQPKSDIDKRLDKLESTVFLQTYDNDNQTTRLARLEKEVYSTINTNQTVPERLANLEKVIVLPIEPSPMSPQDDNLGNNSNNQYSYNTPGQDPVLEQSQQPYNQPRQNPPYVTTQGQPQSQAGTGQPATKRLDDLEMYLFNKTYPKDTVVVRLNRLEAQVNQSSGAKTQVKGSIDSRLRALSKTVLGDEQAPISAAQSQPDISSGFPGVDRYGNPYNQPDQQQQPVYNSRNLYLPSENPYPQPYNTQQPPLQQPNQQQTTYADPDNGPSYQSQPPTAQSTPNPATQADMSAALGNLEHELFKTTYPQEATPSRLSRLETRVFKQPSPDMPDEDRLERLLAVVAADGDNPKGSHRGGSWQALLPFLIMIPLMLL